MKGKSIVVLLLAALASVLVCGLAAASSVPGMSAQEALDRLKAGNERYVSGASQFPNCSLDRRIETVRGGQHPFVTILGCSDSRAPLELLFDQGIGDIFVIRVAGNVAHTDEIGSAEYGVDHLGTSLFVVLGHTKCGAVTAVAQNAEVHGNIPKLVESIGPAVQAARKAQPAAQGEELVDAAIRANVWQSIEDTLKASPTLAAKIKAGQAKLIGAMYDLESGRVEWLGPHPDEARLVAATADGHGPAAHQPAPAPAGEPKSAGMATTIVMAGLGLAAVVCMLLFLDRLL